MPCVGDMHGKPPRNHEHDVEARIQLGQLGPGGEKDLGRCGNPTPLPRPKGFERIGQGAPQFDLDEYDDASPARDDVDLAGRASESSGKNDVPPEPQMQCAERLGETAGSLPPAARRRVPSHYGPSASVTAVSCFSSSSARR